MKKFKKTISRGLPGGPNEEITEITGAISVEGYKISSPDKDNTFNIIPSSNISMKDVEFPILGTDNLGNSQVMMPGAQYTFPGDMVIELPMMADGGRCWPGYKPVSGKMAYSKGSCEKAEDGLELPTKQRGGNTLDDKIAFPLAKKLAAAADATSDFITEKTDDIYNMIKPEITQEDRQFIFDNVRPLSYPTLTTMATTGANLLLKKAGFDTTTPPALDSDGDYQIGDEAWAKSLGVPTKDKYIVPQEEYKPSSAKDSDAKYFKLHDDVIDYTKIMKELSSKDVDHVQYFESLAPFLKKGFMDETEFEQIDPLQNFKVSIGYDEDKKQKYISIYDKYDFKGALNNVIKPYEFYDRHYLPKEQYGAELIKRQNDILRRQAFAESSFNPKAESPAGAQGLTQFTPTTVKELQRLGFINEDFDIFDPKQAVEAQRAYMTYIQNKPYIAKGSEEVQLAKALYAYNRGPSGALRNLTKLKGQYDIYNSLDWLEGINEESRGYIQKVLGRNPEFNIQYDQALKSEDNRSIVDLYQVVNLICLRFIKILLWVNLTHQKVIQKQKKYLIDLIESITKRQKKLECPRLITL